MELLDKGKGTMTSPIIDACIHALTAHYMNPKVYVAITSQGKEIMQNSKSVTLTAKALDKSCLTVVVPLQVSAEWALVHADLKSAKLSMWICKPDNRAQESVMRTLKKYFDIHFSVGQWTCTADYVIPHKAQSEAGGFKLLISIESLLRPQDAAEPEHFRRFITKLCISKFQLYWHDTSGRVPPKWSTEVMRILLAEKTANVHCGKIWPWSPIC